MSKKTLVDLQKRFPIYHAYPIYWAAIFSRGLAIFLVHEEEEITLVDLEREIIVHCVQIRHLWNDFRPTFLSKILRVEIPDVSSILPTFEYFQYEYHEVLVLDLPILRDVELVLVWTVHTLFEYAQFSLLENQFVSPIHKYYFRQDPLCIHVSGSRILLLRAIFLFLFPKWSWTDSCLTLG